MMKYSCLAFILSFSMTVPALAQQTTGNITGRVVDQQGAAVPGAMVTARSPETGFTRAEVSDGVGIYRLAALPAGVYDLRVELSGFTTVSRNGVEVNVARIHTIDFELRVAPVAETVTVTAGAPLISTMSSSVGEVVDPQRIESLPLNGRQFANLAATIPGVGIGFHLDPTKGVNFAPQVNGGAGRNVNFIVDGADNSDDTVGGLLQQFPLEAVQEFNFQTQRFKAEFGRANGGVMNIVTKSGTNMYSGSFFELFRDRALNATTENEKLLAPAGQAPAKGGYSRHQFGGSFGGPIVMNRAHFFFAFERTQEDKTQPMGVQIRALFPTYTDSYPVEYRENIGTGKVTVNLNPAQYVSFRYSRNTNSFPTGAGPNFRPDSWADAENIFNSVNLNHNWVLGGSKLNELILNYSDFRNHVSARPSDPDLTFADGTQASLRAANNSIVAGTNLNAPQTTEQHKFQFRDDFSWHLTGRECPSGPSWGSRVLETLRGCGLGHDFKTGISFIYEPRLYINANSARGVVQYQSTSSAATGAPGTTITTAPLSSITINDGDAFLNLPNKQYGLYFQDDWRASDRLTLNLGVRYDLVTGLDIDQSSNPNFALIQAAAQAGLFDGWADSLKDFGLSPQPDRNNIQPRLGAVYDLRGNGKDILRGGWGIYTDFGYTNSNIILAALDASGHSIGPIYNISTTTTPALSAGYQILQPLPVGAPVGPVPLSGQFADPRLQQPYSIQTNAGWSHELTSNTIVTVDYVNSLGRDLNIRPRVDQLVPNPTPPPTTVRRLSSRLGGAINPPSSTSHRAALSVGESRYDALILGVRRRLSRGVDFSASYTLSEATSNVGAATDELNTTNIIQDPNNPFDDPRQDGPSRLTDARHRITVSAVFQLPYGIQVAPLFFYRSALPVQLIDGRDLNGDGDTGDIPLRAYVVDRVETGVDDTGKEFAKAIIEDVGFCRTVNCGRSAPQSQLNLRVSKVFRVVNRVNIEAIAEVYNLFNALNPATANGTVFSATAPNNISTSLLQPTSFSGDGGRPEQRLGQFGLRVTF